MKIFIVTPSFNAENTIEQTLASVLNQFDPDRIYYHVQDGGSQDNTLAILESWVKKFKNRGITFSFSSEKDNGIYDAINKGFEKFRPNSNDWMGWINSDDQLTGLFAYTLLKQPSSIQWLTGKPAVLAKSGKVIRLERYYSTKLVKHGLCNGDNWFYLQQEGTAWRYSAWLAANGENILAKYKYAADYHLWRGLAEKFELFQCSFPLGIFNIREGQISQVSREKYIEEMFSKVIKTTVLEGNHTVNMVFLKNKKSRAEQCTLNVSTKDLFKLELRNV
jgi:hypothetical protein